MTTRRAETRFRPRIASAGVWVLPVVLVLLSIASQYISGRSRDSPVFSDDEVGYLINALVMSGTGTARVLQGASYYPGFSVLLVPLWWILGKPDEVYRAGVLVSALTAVATIPLYAAIARRVGMSLPNAVSAGAIVTLLPSVTIMSGFVLSENFAGFMVALTVWLAIRAYEKPTVLAFVWVGAASAYTFFVHGRLVGFVGASIVWAIVLLIRRRWAHGLALLVSTAVLALVVYKAYQGITNGLYELNGVREIGGLKNFLTDSPRDVLLVAAGQLWYHIAASVGLASLGAAFLVVRIRREWLARSFGSSSWIALAALALMVVSISYISPTLLRSPFRLDSYIYGRYFQPMASILTLLGICAALGAVRRRVRRPVLLGSLIVLAGYIVLGSHVLPTTATPGFLWIGTNVAGLAQFDWPNVTAATGAPLVAASIAGALGCLFLIKPKSSTTLLVVLGGYFLGSSSLALTRTITPLYASYNDALVLAPVVAKYPHDSVSFDQAHLNGDSISWNLYAFLLEPRAMSLFNSDKTPPTTDLVISRQSWPIGEKAGYKRVAVDTFQNDALWLSPRAQN